MRSIQHQIKINWPVEALFNYVSDVSNNAAWQRQVVHAEWIGESRNMAGAQYVETRNILGKELPATCVLDEFEQFRRRSLTLVSGVLKTHLVMDFERDGEDTLMRLTIACNVPAMYRRAEELFFRNALREGYQNLNRLKVLLESSN